MAVTNGTAAGQHRPTRSTLRLDWATHEAAEYACRHWHYSRTIPAGKSVKVGVWEDGSFRGVVIFSCGSNNKMSAPFGVGQDGACELSRVALTNHNAQVSRVIAIALGFLLRQCPRMRVVISYADTAQGHHGGIYQAGGWVYTGALADQSIIVNGRLAHRRSVHARYGRQSIPWLRANVDPNARAIDDKPKHRYVMPLDDAMRATVERMRKPYPKRTTT